jgi:hypothetical protein
MDESIGGFPSGVNARTIPFQNRVNGADMGRLP